MTANRVVGTLKGLSGAGSPAPVAADRSGDGAAPAVVDEPIGIPVPPASPDLSRQLPPDVALLKVIPGDDTPGRYRFKLEGYFQGRVWTSDESDDAAHFRPGVAIDDALGAAHGEPDSPAALDAAVAYYDFILTWSSTKHALRTWLDHLRKTVQTGLRLIIWDDTDAGIPWELCRLADEGEHAWLGAAFPVTRWTTVHDTGRHDQFSAVDEWRRSGAEIICFEDPSLVPKKGLSITSIVECTSRGELIDLLRELNAQTGRFGLVYVRAHGEHGTSVTSAKLGGIPLVKFESLRMRDMHASGSVVLLNACNSARPVFDPAIGDRANRNFAEIFLRRRARAVVATMGEVPTSTSAALARSVISRARSGGVRIPEFLRNQRALAARGLPEDTVAVDAEQAGAIQEFLYASRYVYFGHPDTLFALEETP